ncbi:MAG TPA: hypothetical protein ENJ79_01205 [Gammaproteobacteria bacterium]|nr:hypothetical protein [Gammaproteobacteria bacterium]
MHKLTLIALGSMLALAGCNNSGSSQQTMPQPQASQMEEQLPAASTMTADAQHAMEHDGHEHEHAVDQTGQSATGGETASDMAAVEAEQATDETAAEAPQSQEEAVPLPQPTQAQ